MKSRHSSKSVFYSVLLWLVCSTAPVIAQQKIENAKISFEFVDKGVKGTVAGFISESVLDWDDLENSVLAGSVATETLDTNNGLRNWSLKSRKYFNKSDYPRMYFKSDRITQDGTRYKVSGTLTIKDISKPLTLYFERSGNSFQGKASLYASDFDINIKKKREDNKVTITFQFKIG